MTIHASPHPRIDIPDQTVTEQLFGGLARRGEGVALTDGVTGQTLTGTALRERIERLAGGLTARGYAAGAVVALMAPNCPDFATVFHGVAWAGGTVTTINPTYTAHEVRRQLIDSGASLLVAAEPVAGTAGEAIEGTSVRELAVIGEGETTLEDLMGEPQREQAPVDPARHIVVLPYSSGTTGLPKGVMLTHRNLVANVLQCRSALDVKAEDVTVGFLPFFHIYGMTALMNLYLSTGAHLVTMPRFDLERFLSLVAEHRPGRLFLVPPVALALAKHPMVEEFDTSSVEQLVCGAAPLGGELGDACARRLGAVMTQAYGMTELSPVSHAVPIGAPRPGASGLTVANCESRVVDPATGEDVPPGEEGELWVRGPNVMAGYLGNEAATRETLTEDGWLKTGDLCIIDEDGYMFVRERVKELIKVKGFQVAPAELEAELVGHEAIRDAAVLGREDEESGEVPVAFVVRADGADLGAEEVKAHIAGRLSSYKHLSEVFFVEEIPKSASGKILRRVLEERLA